MARWILFVAALLGALGVILGAFVLYSLQTAVQGWGLDGDEQSQLLATWDVGVRYQMYHALALLGVGILAIHKPSKSLIVASAAFTFGTLVFSGCLYVLVLSGVKILAAVVPLGGLCMIVGWVTLGVAAWRMKLD